MDKGKTSTITKMKMKKKKGRETNNITKKKMMKKKWRQTLLGRKRRLKKKKKKKRGGGRLGRGKPHYQDEAAHTSTFDNDIKSACNETCEVLHQLRLIQDST